MIKFKLHQQKDIDKGSVMNEYLSESMKIGDNINTNAMNTTHAFRKSKELIKNKFPGMISGLSDKILCLANKILSDYKFVFAIYPQSKEHKFIINANYTSSEVTDLFEDQVLMADRITKMVTVLLKNVTQKERETGLHQTHGILFFPRGIDLDLHDGKMLLTDQSKGVSIYLYANAITDGKIYLFAETRTAFVQKKEKG